MRGDGDQPPVTIEEDRKRELQEAADIKAAEEASIARAKSAGINPDDDVDPTARGSAEDATLKQGTQHQF